jgi:hypothetical protein
MADVTVVCSGCGVKVVASEFADSVTCRSCGKATQVRTPASAPAAGSPGAVGNAKSAGLRLKEAPVHGTSIKPSADIQEIVRKVQSRAGGEGKVSAEWANHPLIGWGVFLILGGLCAWARFGNLLPPDYHEMLKTWGPAVALFFHVVVVVKAFEDSVFYGSLCLLLPPYTFFYLFSICDIFILRALYMGVLAGVGMDTFFALKKLSIEVYITFNSWILSGG